jgi:hypothetical protein
LSASHHEATSRALKVVRFVEVLDSAFNALGFDPKNREHAARIVSMLSSEVLFPKEIWEGWAAQAAVHELSTDSRQVVIGVYQQRAR